MRTSLLTAMTLSLALGGPALAQDRGTLDPRPLPPLANLADPHLPAKQVFGRERAAAPMAPRIYGFYAKGCLAGAEPLPLDGPHWQVMRPSRDRYWGHPHLIRFIERFSDRVAQTTNWPGILIGDMSQPRGGPMLTGHASHQIGLDVDVWLRPMPEERLSLESREFMDSLMVVREDRRDVDPRLFTADTLRVIKDAASDPEVQRIFVNPAIKRAICREADGDRSWLSKVRPMFGHDYHFHVRLYCPAEESSCRPQVEVGGGDGCDASLDKWFSDSILHPKPRRPWPPMPPMTMAALPKPCEAVAQAPGQEAGNR
jgi:penicillin-insensitive murein endopeptidase